MCKHCIQRHIERKRRMIENRSARTRTNAKTSEKLHQISRNEKKAAGNELAAAAISHIGRVAWQKKNK